MPAGGPRLQAEGGEGPDRLVCCDASPGGHQGPLPDGGQRQRQEEGRGGAWHQAHVPGREEGQPLRGREAGRAGLR